MKHIEKSFVFTLLLSVLVCLSSCNQGKSKEREELEKGIAMANEECPIKVDGIGIMESMVLSGNTLTYNFSLDEEMSPTDNEAAMHKRMLNNALANERKSLLMFEKYGISLRYVFTSPSGKQAVVNISDKEIVDALNSNVSPSDAADDILQSELSSTKSQLPIDMGNGMTITDIILDDEVLIYVCTIDETTNRFSTDNFDRVQAKLAIKQDLGTPDASKQALLKNLINTKRELIYRYIGSKSGEKLDIVINLNDLREITKQQGI